MISEFILLIVLLLLNAFLSASEVAIAEMRKSRLAQLVEQGHATARALERLAQDSSRILATLQLGTTLAGFLAAGTAAVTLAPQLAAALSRATWLAPYSLLLAVLIVTFLLGLVMLILGELVPKSLAVRYAEPIALFAARPLDLIATLAAPLVKLIVQVSNVIAAPLGGAARAGMGLITEEEIKTVVDAGEEGGVIEEDEKEMIYSIFDFGDKLAREVMVPRIDLVAIDAATPLAQVADMVIKATHSRVPVYQDTIDNIVGVLYAKDLLRVLRAGDLAAPLVQIVRPAYFVPEAKPASDLLQELQERHVHMAIVVDEYGGVAGLVTIEDILEEIVGDIQDEYDTGEEPLYRQEADGAYVFDARANLDDVSQVLAVTFPPDESFDTLGGFLFAQLGKVPAAGEQLQFGGLSIQVLNVSGRRIGKVRVRRESSTYRSDDERPGTDPVSADSA
jgi:putative hemolysin